MKKCQTNVEFHTRPNKPIQGKNFSEIGIGKHVATIWLNEFKKLPIKSSARIDPISFGRELAIRGVFPVKNTSIIDVVEKLENPFESIRKLPHNEAMIKELSTIVGNGSAFGLEFRPYIIRTATSNDIPEIMELEKIGWAKPLRMHESVIHEIVFSDGSLVAQIAGKIVAVLHTQRIDLLDVTRLGRTPARKIREIYNARGSVLQLISVSALPEYKILLLGNALRNFALDQHFHKFQAKLSEEVQVIAVTRCSHFLQHVDEERRKDSSKSAIEQISARSYAAYVKNNRDPGLNFHTHHGATVVQIVNGYRPADYKNIGNGVLVRYDPKLFRKTTLKNCFHSLSQDIDFIEPQSVTDIESFESEARSYCTRSPVNEDYNHSDRNSEFSLYLPQLSTDPPSCHSLLYTDSTTPLSLPDAEVKQILKLPNTFTTFVKTPVWKPKARRKGEVVGFREKGDKFNVKEAETLDNVHKQDGNYIDVIIEETVRDVMKNSTDGNENLYKADIPFFELGLDSLRILELQERLSQHFENISSTSFFNYPTPERLGKWLKSFDEKNEVKVEEMEKSDELEPLIIVAKKRNGFDSFARKTSNSDANEKRRASEPSCRLRPQILRTIKSKNMSAEPIAIIGMSCRFPGGANTPEKFWDLLLRQVDATSEIPSERWNVDEHYDKDRSLSNKMYTRRGAFIKSADYFDAKFFGISAREARAMDPNQRLVLEVGYEAFYRAGWSKQRLNGSKTGVFVGISGSDWKSLKHVESGVGKFEGGTYLGTASANAVAANRISYVLGLRGPSMSIDTACSSSLVAIDTAVQSLQTGRCEQALVAAVNMLLSPDQFIAYCAAGMLSPGGRCKTFDASADGYARGEGCGAVILKRLSDAKREGCQVLAVIRGCAVNSDGKTAGLTAPNGPAQESVMQASLKKAGLNGSDVDYVETHGTGTKLGDPIEFGAIKAVMGYKRSKLDSPLILGAVKTNIGHLEAAAGMAGLIKAILVLKHKTVPGNLHLKTLNPRLDVNGLNFKIPQTSVKLNRKGKQWKKVDKLIASVNSWGSGGTNANVVLEEAEVPEKSAATVYISRGDSNLYDRRRSRHFPWTGYQGPWVIPISGNSPSSIAKIAQEYHETTLIESITANDVALLASVNENSKSNENLELRNTVIAQNLEEMQKALNDLARGKTNTTQVSTHPRLAFVFTGQGAQYCGMCRSLFESNPLFREAMEECDLILRQHMKFPLIETLYSLDKKCCNACLNNASFSQPALFAIEYALARLAFEQLGLQPFVVIGHSLGEFAAMCAARIIDLENACTIVAKRGKIMESQAKDKLKHDSGTMAAVWASADDVNKILQRNKCDVVVAVVNSPRSIVISGSTNGVHCAIDALSKENIKSKLLSVTNGFHSAQIESFLTPLRKAATKVNFLQHKDNTKSDIKFISTVTGRYAPQIGPHYVVMQARNSVLFKDAVTFSIVESKCSVFIEIGPRQQLIKHIRDIADSLKVPVHSIPLLGRGDNNRMMICRAAAALYESGVNIAWDQFIHGGRKSYNSKSYLRNFIKKKITDPLRTVKFLHSKVHNNEILKRDEIYRTDDKILQQSLVTKISRCIPFEFFLERQIDRNKMNIIMKQKKSILFLSEDSEFALSLKSILIKNGVDLEHVKGQNIDRATLHAILKNEKYDSILCMWPLESRQKASGLCEQIHNLTVVLLSDDSKDAKPSIFFITRDAYSIDKTQHLTLVDEKNTSVWGMAKSVSAILSKTSVTCIDITASESNAQIIPPLVKKILNESKEGRLHAVLRNKEWFHIRVREIKNLLVSDFDVEDFDMENHIKSGTVLVTGSSAVIHEIASILLSRGIQQVFLVSQCGERIDSRSLQELSSKFGYSRILFQTINFDNKFEVLEIVKSAQTSTENGLLGIIHGTCDYGPKEIKSWSLHHFEQIWNISVNAALYLEKAITELNIEPAFFVLQSSISSLFGIKEHFGHCAVTSAFDAIATRRQQRGLVGISVHWGSSVPFGLCPVVNLPSANFDVLSYKESSSLIWNILFQIVNLPPVIGVANWCKQRNMRKKSNTLQSKSGVHTMWLESITSEFSFLQSTLEVSNRHHNLTKNDFQKNHCQTFKHDAHLLLGSRLRTSISTTGNAIFQVNINKALIEFFKGHRIFGKIVCPGMYYTCSVFGVLQKLYGEFAVCSLENVEFLRALVFPDPSNEESVVRSGVINIIVTPTFCDDEVENEIQFGSVSIVSCENVELSNSKWVQHFTCEYSVSAICDNERPTCNNNEIVKDDFGSRRSMYEMISNAGFDYGEEFQWMEKVMKTSKPGCFIVDLNGEGKKYSANVGEMLNPALLDSCIQSFLLLYPNDGAKNFILYPSKVRCLKLWGSASLSDGKSWKCKISKSGEESSSIMLIENINEISKPVLSIIGLEQKLLKFECDESEKAPIVSMVQPVWKLTNDEDADVIVLQKSIPQSVLCLGDFNIESKLEKLLPKSTTVKILSTENINDFIFAIQTQSWDLIIDAHSLSKRNIPTLPSQRDELDSSFETCMSMLMLFQVLQKKDRKSSSPHVIVITNSVYDTTHNDEIEICTAAVWGFVKSVALELPWLRLSCIDVSSKDDLSDALFQKLLNDETNLFYAIRNGVRYIEKLVPINYSLKKASKRFNESTGVIISGGTGALGLLTARLMLDLGAQTVWLLSRSGYNGEKNSQYWDAIKEDIASSRVLIKKCDVSSYANVHEIIQNANNVCRYFGIIHAAGILNDALISNQNASRFLDVWTPKVKGALHFEKAVAEVKVQPLFIVMFSSVISLIGNIGQTTYSAANAELDAITHRLCQNNINATSIQWGPWSDVGMAKDLDFHGSGLRPIPNLDGMRILRNIVFDVMGGSFPAVVTASGFDWSEMSKRNTRLASLVSGLLENDVSNSMRLEPKNNFIRNLLTMNSSDGKILLIDKIKTIVGDLSNTSILDVSTSFESLGLGSLEIVELRNSLQGLTGFPLSVTMAFEHSSIRELTNFIFDKVELLRTTSRKFESKQLDQKFHVCRGLKNRRNSLEAVAIIGIGCRFPGKSDNPIKFWNMLKNGMDAMSMNAPKWRSHGLGPGGYIEEENIVNFDAAEFGISSAEAREMDPQQRILLHVAHEALEDAGLLCNVKSKRDALLEKTGVYIGVGNNDYRKFSEGKSVSSFAATSNSYSLTANRISYCFNLQGPSLAIDTACSASLVAVHQAIKALRNGECKVALAGGISILLESKIVASLNAAGMLSPDGKVKFGDNE
eukprot:g1538.t1